jgi:Domain of unknown function (DUF4440)
MEKIHRRTALAALTASLAQSPLSLPAATPTETLNRADDERVQAIIKGDAAGMQKSFSPELRYAHSNGIIDTRDSFIGGVTSKKMQYHEFDYRERNFTFPSPGIALMTGKARTRVTIATGEVDAELGFLAVWREEKDGWRFLAWQSCRLPKP